MKQYKYFTLSNPTELKDELLDKLGLAGWELVQVIPPRYNDDDWRYYFKQEIIDKS